MKINLFRVLLFTFLVSTIVSAVLYFILVLMFNDNLSILKQGDMFFWASFAELSGIVFFSFLYVVSFFLPLFYIQKNQIVQKTTPELFWRFMPLVTLIASVLAFFVFLISEPENGIEGEAWINIWLFFALSYSGLVAFVYRVKKQ